MTTAYDCNGRLHSTDLYSQEDHFGIIYFVIIVNIVSILSSKGMGMVS